ncbi:MAG: ATP-binding protein, partial [Calditrichota bacterium]
MLTPKHNLLRFTFLLCLAFGLFLSDPLPAQQKSAIAAKLDSIEAILEQGNLNRDARLEHLLYLSSNYWRLDPKKSQQYAERAVRIAKQQGTYESEVFALRNLATSFWIRGQQELATPYALQALELSQQHDFKDGIVSSYIMLGLISDETSQLQQSITYYQNALDLAIEENNLERTSTIHNNMAAVFYKQKKYEDALHHFQESLRIRRQLNLADGIAEAEGNIAQVLMVSGRYQEAREILERVLQSAVDRDDKNSIIIATEEIGVTYLREGNLELADEFLLKALALAKEMGTIKWQKEIYGYLLEIESLRKNPEKTLAYFKMYDLLKDSLYNVAKVAQVSELQTQYDTEKKIQELSALRERQRFERLFFIAAVSAGVLLLVLLIALFRFRTLRNRQQLRAREAEAEHLAEIDRLKSRFFANISHEFRTPLTLIQGPVDILLQSDQSEQTQRQLQLIQTNTNRLLRLINQLMELSRIESGKMELKASQQDIVPFIRNHVMTFHSLAKQRNIELTFYADEPTFGLFFDPEKVEHIIINLVSNAIKFTQENGKVSVHLKRIMLEEKPHLELSVRDSGIGIAKDYQEHIFERFFQVDSSNTRQYQGTGIGLALTKELVELHQGKIKVESQPDVGSTFHVYLPFG